MATATPQDKIKSLQCSVCLEVFTQPKLLPCYHSFCLKCLEGLASQHGGATLPCPQCRTVVTVPAGGVTQFQTNFYLSQQDLDLAREEMLCSAHSGQTRDMFCTDCQLLLCSRCVLSKHRNHNTQDLSEAETKAQLTPEQRLWQAVSRVRLEVEVEQRERQFLQDKRAAVEAVIRDKASAAVSLVEKCCDDLLGRVDAIYSPLQDDVDSAIKTKSSVLDDLSQLQQLNLMLTTDSASSLLTMARKMREGRGSTQALQDVIPARRDVITHSVLPSTVTVDTLRDAVQGFLGVVRTEQLDLMPDVMKVEEKFDCSRGEHVEVFALCPGDIGYVRVSYAHRGLQKDAAAEIFTESGEDIGNCDNNVGIFGKESFKCIGRSNGVYIYQTECMFTTYTKSVSYENSFLYLANNLQGQAVVWRSTIKRRKPLKLGNVIERSINVGCHRAWDVDNSQQWMAVVEEAPAAGQPRTVRLYGPHQADPVTTYTPPSPATFDPSDVIFFSLGGLEVLLIADKAGDSVHVVHVQQDPVTLTFVRHLAPGCPLLLQPTAVNADHQGRLWVACRGGRILTMTPLTS